MLVNTIVIDMEENAKNEKKLLGAFTDEKFVIEFRDYCREHDFKHRRLIPNLVKWWFGLDEITQEHIYRGRFAEAHRQIAANLEAEKIVSGAEADAAKQKQRPRRRRAKSG